MAHKQEQFNSNEAGIIAHSRVQVLDSAPWADTTIPVFALGIRINLSVMEHDEGAWLRIHRSPDHFVVVERSKTTVRLQHDWLWVLIGANELDSLFAKAEAVRVGCTGQL